MCQLTGSDWIRLWRGKLSLVHTYCYKFCNRFWLAVEMSPFFKRKTNMFWLMCFFSVKLNMPKEFLCSNTDHMRSHPICINKTSLIWSKFSISWLFCEVKNHTIGFICHMFSGLLENLIFGSFCWNSLAVVFASFADCLQRFKTCCLELSRDKTLNSSTALKRKTMPPRLVVGANITEICLASDYLYSGSFQNIHKICLWIKKLPI